MSLRIFLSFVLLAGCSRFAAAREGSAFISNAGQWPREVRYMAALPGGAFFLTNTGFTYNFYSQEDVSRLHDRLHESGVSTAVVMQQPVRCHAYRVRFEGCNAAAGNNPKGKRPNYYNFFLGKDESKWAGGVPAYEEVVSSHIYRGISLRVYGKDAALKYDFEISPGADAGLIKMRFEGATPTPDAAGELRIQTSVNEVLEAAPYAYQVVQGKRRQVACRYLLRDGCVRFDFPNGYDRSRLLVIDPALIFGTYSGASSQTLGWSAAYDSSGSLYAGGQSQGIGWPVTIGAYQTSFAGLMDLAIHKYNPLGTGLIYSTYYGGGNVESPTAMVVNAGGELSIAGATTSTDLPVTTGCFDGSANGGSDLFVAHFNAAGTALLGATYLGGSGNEGDVSTLSGILANRGGIETDDSGNIYIAFGTSSANFPTSAGAFQTTPGDTLDAIICKLDPSCSRLLFSTYLGGNGADAAIDLKRNSKGDVVVCGGTFSSNFPGAANGWQASAQGSMDGFVATLSHDGRSLLHATYAGTSNYDDASKLALDAADNVYVTGMNIGGAFPVTPGCYRAPKGLNYVARFDTGLSTRMVSTTFSDSVVLLNPTAFSVDACGNIFFAGWAGYSVGLPTTADAFQTATASFWMCALSPNFLSLSYASYFGNVGDHIDGGSSRISPEGVMYHSLCTRATSFPTTSGAYAPAKQTGTGAYDVASWKFDFQPKGMKADFSINPADSFCAPGIVIFQNSSTSSKSFRWDFGDGSGSTLPNPPPHVYADTGIFMITLYAFNDSSCRSIDSASRIIHVYRYRDSLKLRPPDSLLICPNAITNMKVDPRWVIRVTPDSHVSYLPSGGSGIAFFPDTTTSYEVSASLTDDCGILRDTIRFTIATDTTMPPPLPAFTDSMLCKGDTAVYHIGRRLSRFSLTPAASFAWSSDSMSIRFFPASTTSYRLIGTSSNRCRSRADTLRFSIQRSKLKAGFAIDPKLTDLLSPTFYLFNHSQNASSCQWFLGETFLSDAANPSYTATDTGRYCFTLVASDEFCHDTATDCGEVIAPLVYIPSAFTPNGDQTNDIFRPVSRNLDILEFSVYNRYGERVFVTSNNRDGWDGTFKGKPCDMGTYFYQVRYRVLQREPLLLKGDVTLIR